MSEAKSKSGVYKYLKIAAITIFIPVTLLASLAAFGSYLNWAALGRAKVFCDAIQPGSDISIAIDHYETQAGGKESSMHYGYPEEGFSKDSHTFMFPGLGLGKATCDVTLTKNGKVVSKESYFEDD